MTSVTARALSLLAAFDSAHRSQTLSELARRSDLPLATAHRLVSELVEWGALVRQDDGAYVVGRRLWSLGLLAPTQTGLRELASPYLHDLYGATGATVHLAVLDGARALYLDRLAGHASVPVISEIGGRLPLHATGVGKVLLAHAPRRGPGGRARPADPAHEVHRHAAGRAGASARTGPRRGCRHDERGDVPRRVLGRRSGAGSGPGDRSARGRRAAPPPAGQARLGPAGRCTGDRAGGRWRRRAGRASAGWK